jgi:hypothetical protein
MSDETKKEEAVTEMKSLLDELDTYTKKVDSRINSLIHASGKNIQLLDSRKVTSRIKKLRKLLD